jgi:hypothetical protein
MCVCVCVHVVMLTVMEHAEDLIKLYIYASEINLNFSIISM